MHKYQRRRQPENYDQPYKLYKNEKRWQRHMEEQRNRLEHFLSVATQVRAMRDAAKIREMLKELHETGQALPLQRMNELRNLQVMTSPYNQTLQTMLKVENV